MVNKSIVPPMGLRCFYARMLCIRAFFRRCITIANAVHQINEEITDKEIRLIGNEGEQLGIMSDQIFVLGSLFMYVLPALVLVLGLVIWIRRRHR